MKDAVIENTCYSLLLYMLYDENWRDKDYFIFGNRIKQSYIDKLNQKVNNLEYLKSFDYSYKKRTLLFFKLKFKEILKLTKYDVLYGNVNQIYIPFRTPRRFVIEDGLGTYIQLNQGDSLKESVSCFLNLKRGILKNKVEKYLLTMSSEVPNDVKKDVINVRIHKLWNNLNTIDKNEILDVFCMDTNYLNKINRKKIILLTQCFSEDGFISEKDKIQIYKDIISKYKESDLLIKTHPREKTNYREIFPNIEIIDEPFPFELISLHGIKFEKAITLTSSSVFSFNYDLDIDYFGTEKYSQLEKNTSPVKSKFIKNNLKR